jgi:hypothetical protein
MLIFPVIIANTQVLVFLKNPLQNTSAPPTPKYLACGLCSVKSLRLTLWFLQFQRVKKSPQLKVILNALG